MCFFKMPSAPQYAQPIQQQVATTAATAPVADKAPKPTAAPTATNTGGTNTVTNNTTTTEIKEVETPQEQDKDVADSVKQARIQAARRKSENSTNATGGAGLVAANTLATGTKQLMGA